jgi:8-oxo-dGTP diphosphatase
MLELYNKQSKCLVALDSIIFGFDGEHLKLLLVKRGLEQSPESWSLMGGWLTENENLDEAAARILFQLTGLQEIYLEQLTAYGNPNRDPITRTVSVTYFALINVFDYENFELKGFEAKWFDLNNLPSLLFDHKEMLENAIYKLRMKASSHPVGFELLPEKFTLLQLQTLYEAIFDQVFDKRNFSRKMLTNELIIKLDEKQKGASKKGAFLYRLNPEILNKPKDFNF